MGNTRDITGKIVSRFLVFGIIIGFIAFILENVIPHYLEISFDVPTMIIQTAIFFVAALITITLATVTSLKKTKLTKDDAETVVKSVRTVLIMAAILVMFFNFFYCGMLCISEKKDIENDVKGNYSELSKDEKEEQQTKDKKEILQITTIYLVVKELVTIVTFVYMASYVRFKVFNKTESIEEKNE